jgi:hypothetical protein
MVWFFPFLPWGRPGWRTRVAGARGCSSRRAGTSATPIFYRRWLMARATAGHARIRPAGLAGGDFSLPELPVVSPKSYWYDDRTCDEYSKVASSQPPDAVRRGSGVQAGRGFPRQGDIGAGLISRAGCPAFLVQAGQAVWRDSLNPDRRRFISFGDFPADPQGLRDLFEFRLRPRVEMNLLLQMF